MIIDCANENDIIMFSTENTIIPLDTIAIDKNLILTYFSNDLIYSSDLSETEIKAIFSCPNDKAIFDIISNNVTFANLEISDCHFSKTSQASPITSSHKCDTGSKKGAIKFHFMQFRNNTNHLQPACFNFENAVCSTLEIKNTDFDENESGGIVIGNLTPINAFYNVSITGNKFQRGKSLDAPPITTLFKLDTGSSLVVDGLIANDNIGLIFSLTENTYLEINNARFEGNSGSLMYPVMPACINGTNAEITIKNTLFSKSRPLYIEIEGSRLEIANSTFQGINDIGLRALDYSAIKTINSQVLIYNSHFYYNTGGEYSGALNTVNSDISIDNSVFFKNDADYGSALFVTCATFRCNVMISNSAFIENACSFRGAVVLQGDFDGNIENSVFYRNGAGGTFADSTALNSTLVVSDSDYIENQCPDGFGQGAALHVKGIETGIIQIRLNNCNLNKNKINNDGIGCGIYALNANLNVKDSNLAENDCTYGSGVYLEDSALNLENSVLSGNLANEGAGLYLDSKSQISNVTVKGSILKENKSKGNGAVLSCRGGCQVKMTHLTISDNNSGAYGGVIYSGDVVSGKTDVKIVESLFYNNSAMDGACLTCVLMCNIEIEGSGFYLNYAESATSVLHVEDQIHRSNLTVTDSVTTMTCN